MSIVSQMHVLVTTGDVVKAESRAGQMVEVVEFFNPDQVCEEMQDEDLICIDLPADTWRRMGEPTEITVSLVPGDITGDMDAR